MKDSQNVKNGIELLLSLQLVLELIDEYKLKGRAKNTANLFKTALEKDIIINYGNVYNKDPEFISNLLNAKNKIISDVASLNEADCALLSDFISLFMDNIEEVREKKTLMFDKLL